MLKFEYTKPVQDCSASLTSALSKNVLQRKNVGQVIWAKLMGRARQP